MYLILACLAAALALPAAAGVIDEPYVEDVAARFVLPGQPSFAVWGETSPLFGSGGWTGALPLPHGYLVYGDFGAVYCNFTSPATPISLAPASYAVAVTASVGSVVAAAVDAAGVLRGVVTSVAFVTLACVGLQPYVLCPGILSRHCVSRMPLSVPRPRSLLGCLYGICAMCKRLTSRSR